MTRAGSIGTLSSWGEAGGEAARAGARDVRSSTAVINGTRNARMPHPPGTKMDSGSASVGGCASRLIVSLHLQKRPIELMVAQRDRVQEQPELGLLAPQLLAMGELLLSPPIPPRSLFHLPQQLPLALGCHHLRHGRAGPRPGLALHAGGAGLHARERSAQVHGHGGKPLLPEQTAHIRIPLCQRLSDTDGTSAIWEGYERL